MRKLLLIALLGLFATTSFAAEAQPPLTESQKTLYAIGLIVSRSLSVFNLSPAELDVVKRGLTDAVEGKALDIDPGVYNRRVQELARERRKELGDKMAALDKGYIDKVAKDKGAVKTASGMVFLSEKEGTGAVPGPTDTVKVNYRGTLPDGKEFDSSYKRGQPTEFRLDGVIKCWTEGLQKMKVGGKAKLVCPASLAYGEAGAGDVVLPGATLVFDVELLDVKHNAENSAAKK